MSDSEKDKKPAYVSFASKDVRQKFPSENVRTETTVIPVATIGSIEPRLCSVSFFCLMDSSGIHFFS